MRYLSEDTAQLQGLGYVGELYQDLDGELYGWIEADETPGMGYWQGLELADEPALDGLGALYAAPDGTVYQLQGFADDAEAEAEPEPERPTEPADQPATTTGTRRPPPRRLHARAHPPIGPGRGRPGARQRPPRRKGGFLRKLLPIAKFATRFIPGVGPVVSSGIDVASKLLKPKGVASIGGLGALYAAPDGTVYQVQGGMEDELQGLTEEQLLQGLEDDDELRGYAEDGEFEGADDDELHGMAEEPLDGFEQAYVRDPNPAGLEAYLPAAPPQTRWLAQPADVPEVWKPLW